MTAEEQGYLDMQDIMLDGIKICRRSLAAVNLKSYPLLSKDFNYRFNKVKVYRREK